MYSHSETDFDRRVLSSCNETIWVQDHSRFSDHSYFYVLPQEHIWGPLPSPNGEKGLPIQAERKSDAPHMHRIKKLLFSESVFGQWIFDSSEKSCSCPDHWVRYSSQCCWVCGRDLFFTAWLLSFVFQTFIIVSNCQISSQEVKEVHLLHKEGKSENCEQETSGQEGVTVHVQAATSGWRRWCCGSQHLPSTPISPQPAVASWIWS